MSVTHSARPGGIIEVSSRFSLTYVVCSRGDSNKNIKHTIFNRKKKIPLNYSKSAAIGVFLGTQEQVRKSRGKRAISVRATEVLLYSGTDFLANVAQTIPFPAPVTNALLPSNRISMFPIAEM